MKHKCPIESCAALVPNKMLMCGRHWHMVPREIQNAVWRTYRRAPGSTPHLTAIKAAIAAVDNLLAETK